MAWADNEKCISEPKKPLLHSDTTSPPCCYGIRRRRTCYLIMQDLHSPMHFYNYTYVVLHHSIIPMQFNVVWQNDSTVHTESKTFDSAKETDTQTRQLICNTTPL